MLDIKFIRENKEKVKKAIEDKGIKLDLDELLKFDEKRRDFITKIDSLRSERNKVAKERNVEKGKAIKVNQGKPRKSIQSLCSLFQIFQRQTLQLDQTANQIKKYEHGEKFRNLISQSKIILSWEKTWAF
jgi:seryl-tRNA synthetase